MLERSADRDLIRRIAERDADAAAELFDRYGQEIFAVAARLTHPSEAEDLLQEVFTRALRRASSYRGDASVRTWLHAIGGEQRRRLLAALERLPEDQAIVLELSQIDGLTHGEIGHMLRIKPATSRKRLQRALVNLQRSLASTPLRSRHARLESWSCSQALLSYATASNFAQLPEAPLDPPPFAIVGVAVREDALALVDGAQVPAAIQCVRGVPSIPSARAISSSSISRAFRSPVATCSSSIREAPC